MNTDIIVLTGFLGSGKTTLLMRMLSHLKREGKRPAVIINELGDVNLDGLLVDGDVPMSELLSGCICCTIRGDLGLALTDLVQREQPDVILIESTGAANPVEIIDVVTEASMLVKTRLQAVVTVVDGGFFMEQVEKAVGKTWRLLREQVRGATHVVVNKVDLLGASGADERVRNAATTEKLRVAVRAVNAHAALELVERCEVDVASLLGGCEASAIEVVDAGSVGHKHTDHKHEEHNHECGAGCEHDHAHTHDEHHHSHSHLLVFTKYLQESIDSAQFTREMRELPASVYRAKGIVTFADTGQRVMFQYAYRELECMPIAPGREVHDVAVFIGEHLPEQELERLFG